MINRNKFNSALAAQGITHYELAKRIGISKNTMSNKVNNRGYFNTEQIDNICEILQIHDDLEKVSIFLYGTSQNRD